MISNDERACLAMAFGEATSIGDLEPQEIMDSLTEALAIDRAGLATALAQGPLAPDSMHRLNLASWDARDAALAWLIEMARENLARPQSAEADATDLADRAFIENLASPQGPRQASEVL